MKFKPTPLFPDTSLFRQIEHVIDFITQKKGNQKKHTLNSRKKNEETSCKKDEKKKLVKNEKTTNIS